MFGVLNLVAGEVSKYREGRKQMFKLVRMLMMTGFEVTRPRASASTEICEMKGRKISVCQIEAAILPQSLALARSVNFLN